MGGDYIKSRWFHSNQLLPVHPVFASAYKDTEIPDLLT